MRRRILHVIYSLYRGGAERLIETQVLAGNGDLFTYHVCAVAGGGDLAAAIERAGARVFLMNKERRGDITVLARISRLISQQRIDLLHVHNMPGTLWGTFAADLATRRVPIVRTEHRPWLPGELSRIHRFLYPYFTKRAARVICVSQFVRSAFAERFPRFSEKYVTIPNGVRLDAFRELPDRNEARTLFKLPVGTPLVGTIGRLVPVKNHRLLIDAFARVRATVPDAHLAILGEGPLAASLASHAADLRLSDEVSFVTPTAKAETFLGCLDLFALSSDSEGMPLTLLEAMAAGLPVVATCVGGIPEVIEDGSEGLVVPRGSAEGLAGAIVSLLSAPARSSSMARKGREKIERLYSAERTVAATERIYSEVLGAEL